MFCTQLSLLSRTIRQCRRCVLQPITSAITCNHAQQKQLSSLSYKGKSNGVNVLYCSVRFLGIAGMVGSITTQNISTSGQNIKLQLVQQMPPILAAKMERRDDSKQEDSGVNSDNVKTQHQNDFNADNVSTKEKQQQTIIDFTQPDKAALLQRHQQQRQRRMYAHAQLAYHKKCLTSLQRRSLINMIYKAHYEPMDHEQANDGAVERGSQSAQLLWDEACMQLEQIIKWACKVQFQQQQQHPIQENKRLSCQQHLQDNINDTKSESTDYSVSNNNDNKSSSPFTYLSDNKQDNERHEAEEKHLQAIRKRIKRAVLQRVDLHKPLSYIIGNQPFYGCDIRCMAPLLCPRPQTEMWVHWYVQQHLKPALKSQQVQQKQKVSWQVGSQSRTHHWLSTVSLSKWMRRHKHISDEKCKQSYNEAQRCMSASTSLSGTSGARAIKVLDMCCGTGCVGVAIAKHIPTAHITAVDIELQAVQLTAKNAKINHIASDCFHVMTSNLFECFLQPLPTSRHKVHKYKLWKDKNNCAESLLCDESNTIRNVAPQYIGYFDALVCNPPYILLNQYDTLSPSVRLWESKVALVGDTDRASRQYMYFKQILQYGAQLLKGATHRVQFMRDVPNIVIEVGLQAELVASMMESSGLYDEVQIHLDMAQRQRWISAISK